MEVLNLLKKLEGNDNPIEFVNNKAPMIPIRLLDNTKLKSLWWKPKYNLDKGLKETLNWIIRNQSKFKSFHVN